MSFLKKPVGKMIAVLAVLFILVTPRVSAASTGGAFSTLSCLLGNYASCGEAGIDAATDPNSVAAHVGTAAEKVADSNPLGLLQSSIEWITLQLSQLVGYIAGALVLVEAYLVQIVLHISFDIIHSPLVEMGFPITLSLANLVFVAGIIFVAVATILHLESYGIKNVLWKLLVMAVLVNFGLIIAGTVLNFSDNITSYMVDSVAPTDKNGGLDAFATTIAAAFNPQDNIANINKAVDAKFIQNYQDAARVSGAEFGKLFTPIFGMVLAIFSYLVILIGLGALVVMLFMRYIQLSFLLISLPFAWAAWPFPAFHNKTSEWWEKFWKTAFYPIPVVFSLWLVLMFAQKMSTLTNTGILPPGSSPEATGGLQATAGILANFLTGVASPIAGNLIRALILSGIMIAGLSAANSMGATFAGSAMNAIKAGQNRAKNAVTSRIRNRAERVKLKAQDTSSKVQQAYLRNVKIPLRKADEKMSQAIGDRLAVATAGLTGGNISSRLGFYRGEDKTIHRIKKNSDGTAALTWDRANLRQGQHFYFRKLINNQTGKVEGEIEVDANGNVVPWKIQGNDYIKRDGTKINMNGVRLDAAQSTISMDQTNLRNVKAEEIQSVTAGVNGEQIKTGQALEFRQNANGDWEVFGSQDFWTEKNAEGDYEVKWHNPVKNQNEVVDVIKKTAIQDAKDSKQTWSAGHIIHEGKANVTTYIKDLGGNEFAAARKRDAVPESKRLEEDLHHVESEHAKMKEEQEKKWAEARKESVAADLAGVAGATLGGFESKGGGESKSSPKGGDKGGHH